jgi:hypothetical protein
VFRPPLSNPAQKRTLRPIYAQHQATPYAGFLDPNWDKHIDIYPGSVMARTTKEQFTLFTGAANQTPFGLAALFVAPVLGIDEVVETGTNLFTVWVGDSQAVFEVLAPAFDQTANWGLATNGSRQMLTANASGLLTPTGVNEFNVIAELIDVPSTDKILIRLNKWDVPNTLAVAGGS